MAAEAPIPLEDPKLKAAMKAALGDHHASDQLRQRVKAAMAQARTGSTAAPAAEAGSATPTAAPATVPAPSQPLPSADPIPFPRQVRWGRRALAIAAMLALAAGVLFVAFGRESAPDPNYHLFDEMVDEHKDWNPASEEITMIAPSEAIQLPLATGAEGSAKLAGLLKERLNRLVPVPDFKSEGWELTAAAVRKIDDKPAALFVLTKGTQRITVYSMAATALVKPLDDGKYASKIDDFPMAGAVRWDGLHCVICPVDMKLDDAVRLRDLLMKNQPQG